MNPSFLQTLKVICIENFGFNHNISEKQSDANNIASTKKSKLSDLKFPNEEISNLFNYECLSLLLKTNEFFRKNKENLIKDICIVIYDFYSGNINAFDYLDIFGYSIPFNKEKISKKTLIKKKILTLFYFLIFF